MTTSDPSSDPTAKDATNDDALGNADAVETGQETTEPNADTSDSCAQVGDTIELTIENPAHGGHCVARHQGRVIFVRNTAPGEHITATLTDAAPKDTFWRADTTTILKPHTDRIDHIWPEATGPSSVGGAELGHLRLKTQRAWKKHVIEEQLQRLGNTTLDVPVNIAPGDDNTQGLHYRTRIDLVTDPGGKLAMRGHRSRDRIRITDMPLASPDLEVQDLLTRRWPANTTFRAIAPSSGDRRLLLINGEPWRLSGRDNRPSARTSVRETVTCTIHGTEHTFDYRVAGTGFWQVHREAPALLANHIINQLTTHMPDQARDASIADLYSGAGLFTLPLAHLVGQDGEIFAVESHAGAHRDARRNIIDQEHVTLIHADTAASLGAQPASAKRRGQRRGRKPLPAAVQTDVQQLPARLDAVVLDPPRAGAGKDVVTKIVEREPDVVVYVACDPASLGRDVGAFGRQGYELVHAEGFDVFPHTHHVETVATFKRV